MKTRKIIKKQDGAALVVGLVLLVVVTVLAISGMNTATTELAIARNDQNHENAFQAAETGLEYALAHGFFNTTSVTVLTPAINSNDEVRTEIEFEDTTVAEGYSFDTGAAYHFVATATAESNRIAGGGTDTDRDASAVHTQAFYIVGPKAPTL